MHVGPGKSNLPFELRRRAGDCSRVTAGQTYLIEACVQKLMFLSRGDRDLGVAFQTHPGSQSSSRVEAKKSAVLYSRDGYLVDPLSGLKGVKPPEEFLEKTRDCSPGLAGKEGPRNVMTGTPHCFLELRRQCGVSHKVRPGTQGASRVAPGKSGLHESGERDCGIALESW